MRYLKIIITLFIITAIASFVFNSQAANDTKPQTNNTDLNLTVTNIKSSNGTIVIAIYDNASEFKNFSSKVHSLLSLKANKPSMSLNMKNFPTGQYAISVMHDENSNQALEIDKNQMPSEAYAYSNNVGKFSTPSFKDAMFSHRGSSNLTLKLIQPR